MGLFTDLHFLSVYRLHLGHREIELCLSPTMKKAKELEQIQSRHKALIDKAANDPHLNKFIQPTKAKPDRGIIYENESTQMMQKKNRKYLTKSRSTASLLPAIHQHRSKTSTSTSSIPSSTKWSATNTKFRENQFQQVLKLQKLVQHKARKRLSKSHSTNVISLNQDCSQSTDTGNRSLSWDKHLELLQEYDYNRVILQELCTKIQFDNKDGGELLSSLITRNNAIIKEISTALGFERNRIDSITSSNRQLTRTKTALDGELVQMKQKFDNIKHQISAFNTAQSTHTKQLEMARKSATESKLKLHDNEYKSHLVHLEYSQEQDSLLKRISKLQLELKSRNEDLATFRGYDIQQLFCVKPVVAGSTQLDESSILLITGLQTSVKIEKIKSWFGATKYIQISPMFPQCIYHIDADVNRLPHALFVQYDSFESAQFIQQLLHNRKIEACNPTVHLLVYFAREYPTKWISVRSDFSKTHLLRLYNRFGRVENITLSGQSYIVRFTNEGQAAAAILNTHGRRMTLLNESNPDNHPEHEDSIDVAKICKGDNTTTSSIDAVFANDIGNIQFDDDEPEMKTLSKASEQRIFKLESKLDEMENLLAVEWTPPEPAALKQKRLKLQQQYQPPNMGLVER